MVFFIRLLPFITFLFLVCVCRCSNLPPSASSAPWEFASLVCAVLAAAYAVSCFTLPTSKAEKGTRRRVLVCSSCSFCRNYSERKQKEISEVKRAKKKKKKNVRPPHSFNTGFFVFERVVALCFECIFGISLVVVWMLALLWQNKKWAAAVGEIRKLSVASS